MERVSLQVMNAERFKVDMAAFPIISRVNASLLEHKAFQVTSPGNQIDCPDKAWRETSVFIRKQ